MSRAHDALHAVCEGQHKACGQRPSPGPGVHQGGRVWQILERGHDLEEPLRRFRDLFVVCAVVAIRPCQGVGHATEHALGVLDVLAGLAFSEVAFLDHDPGVFGQVCRPERIGVRV